MGSSSAHYIIRGTCRSSLTGFYQWRSLRMSCLFGSLKPTLTRWALRNIRFFKYSNRANISTLKSIHFWQKYSQKLNMLVFYGFFSTKCIHIHSVVSLIMSTKCNVASRGFDRATYNSMYFLKYILKRSLQNIELMFLVWL